MWDYIIEQLNSQEITTVSAAMKLVVSFIFGAIIGIERQQRRQNAGMRTITLICVGSTAAMMLSIWIPQSYPDMLNGDPGRIAAQILTGIGFLGAGSIIQSKGNVRGLTTAACIWVIAIVGMCVGAGMYLAAAILTVMSLFILVTLERLEKMRLLSGEIKQISITFGTDTPDVETAVSIVKNNLLFVFNTSTSRDYASHSSTLTLRVQAKAKDTYEELFKELHEKCPDITAIGIYDA